MFFILCSTPDTPFTLLVLSLLEELDFSNNSLELIKPVLRLKQIPFLKKLSLDNNPWQCSCKTINDLAVKLFFTSLYHHVKRIL